MTGEVVYPRWRFERFAVVVATAIFVAVAAARAEELAAAEASSNASASQAGSGEAHATSEEQAAREAALSQMLSGATLEGSFTDTAQAKNGTKLDREKYTLGEVKKVAGEVWQFPARIQYGGKDVTLPIMLPVKWAGDTPVVVVDTVDLPGFGAVSARVMFFEGHYAGFWKHGEHSGNLFGLIHSAKTASDDAAKDSPEQNGKNAPRHAKPSSGNKPPAIQQPQQ